MVKVKSFDLSGIECIFWSNDHNPPHFHAIRRGEWQCKVFFLENRNKMLEMVEERKRMTKSQRKDLLDTVEKHRGDLLEEWEEECLKKGMTRNDDEK
jgi:hypothetical protein